MNWVIKKENLPSIKLRTEELSPEITGECNTRKKEIAISEEFIRIASEKDVKNVILHEVGHFAAPSSGVYKEELYAYVWTFYFTRKHNLPDIALTMLKLSYKHAALKWATAGKFRPYVYAHRRMIKSWLHYYGDTNLIERSKKCKWLKYTSIVFRKGDKFKFGDLV